MNEGGIVLKKKKPAAKQLLCFIFLLVTFFVINIGQTEAAAVGQTVTVSTDTLNVRSGPSVENDVVGTLGKNEQVVVKTVVDNWYKIAGNDIEGYVSAEFVTDSSTGSTSGSQSENNTNTVQPVTADKIGAVIAARLNVRSTAEANKDNIIGTLSKGRIVTIISVKDGWCAIEFDKQTAYVAQAFVATVTPEASLGVGVVRASQVNIRIGADISYKISDTVHRGQMLTVISARGDWYKIKYNQDQDGFIKSEYIELIKTADAADIQTGTVAASSMNLYSGPGYEYEVVGSVVANQQLTITGETAGWYLISYNGTTVYADADYISTADKKATVVENYSENYEEEPEEATGSGTVSGSEINVRSGPGTDYDILGQLKQGERLELISVSDGWYKINYNNQAGYVRADLIEGADLTEDDNDDSGSTKVTITGDVVNVRSGPGSSNSVVGSMNKGDTAAVTGYEDGWYEIEHEGLTGYVSSEFVKAE